MNQINNPATEPEQDTISGYADQLHQIELEGYELGVKKARNALFWVAGLVFLSEILYMFMGGVENFNVPLVIAIALVESGIFVALAFYTRKKPYTAIIFGIIAFSCVILLAIVVGAMESGAAGAIKGLFSGVIIRVIIFVNLIRPLKDAKALQQAKEEQLF